MACVDSHETQADDRPDAGDQVRCFVTGQMIPRATAVLVPLGPGNKVWMASELCRERDRDRFV